VIEIKNDIPLVHYEKGKEVVVAINDLRATVQGKEMMVQQYIKYLLADEYGGIQNLVLKIEPLKLPEGARTLSNANIGLHRQLVHRGVVLVNDAMLSWQRDVYSESNEEELPDEWVYTGSKVINVDINIALGIFAIKIELSTRAGSEEIEL